MVTNNEDLQWSNRAPCFFYNKNELIAKGEVMKVNHAEIVISAVAPQQYPETDLPEIALAGRSNVGKSSFINTLIERKNLARTSGKPGKTQTLNFYLIENKLHFVDVPGYGYAKVSKTERAKWGKMIETYLTTRKQLKAVVILIDVRHDPSKEDCQMYDYLKYYDLPVIVVATKADKIPRGKWQSQTNQVKKCLNFVDTDTFILFSAVSKMGKAEAWKAIEGFCGI